MSPSGTPVTFRMGPRPLVLPDGCACCLAPASATFFVYARKREIAWGPTALSFLLFRNARFATRREVTRFAFPACAACKRHIEGTSIARTIALFGCPAAAILSVIVLEPEALLPAVLGAIEFAMLPLIVAVVVATLRTQRGAVCARGAPITARYTPEKIDYELTFANRVWGERFVAANSGAGAPERIRDDDPFAQVAAEALGGRSPVGNPGEGFAAGYQHHFVPGLGVRKTPEAIRYLIKVLVAFVAVSFVLAVCGFAGIMCVAARKKAEFDRAHPRSTTQQPPRRPAR